MSRPRATKGTPESIALARDLEVGDRVRFRGERQARFKVQARNEHFVILAKPFNVQKTVLYTVIDLERGIRGPDDSWATGYETPEEIADALAKFASGYAALSERRSVALLIEDVKEVAHAP